MPPTDPPPPARKAAPEPQPSTPNSWRGTLAGLVVFSVAAIACAFLVMRYLEMRPTNLSGKTEALTNQIEQLLLDNGVSENALTRTEPVVRTDQSFEWTFTEFTAEVSDMFSLDGLERLVKKLMTQNDVIISASVIDVETRILHGYIRDLEFVVIKLHQPQPEPPPPPPPLAMSCEDVIEQAKTLLLAHGVQMESLMQASPVPFLADIKPVRLILTQMSDYNAAAWTALFENQFMDVDATAQPSIQPDGTLLLELSIGGDVCVEVVIPGINTSLTDYEKLPLDSEDLENGELHTPAAEGPKLIEGEPPRLAIIVDDGGYGGATTDAILALDSRLTLAILPDTPKCSATSKAAVAKGFEVLLHMPMETARKKRAFDTELTTDMNAQKIKKATAKALEQVPEAVGVNNHTGSKFTTNPHALAAFLDVLRKQSLFFVDSRTTPKTKCMEIAKKVGVRAASRDVFLDNNADEKYIAGQFEKLIAVAKKRGAAIGICHFRPVTAATLGKLLPTLKEEGVELVHVSELIP